ncbi:MAG: VIT1/CCC1 transporter family protein [Anaerolineae bacterium]
MEHDQADTKEADSQDIPDKRKARRALTTTEGSQSRPMTPLYGAYQRWREYSALSGADAIARRAFANNSFDGVLTMVGVVMGSFAVGVQEAKIVVVTGLSTALAIGVSGGWGAYLAESAERKREISELERTTLTHLGDTRIGKAARSAVWTVATVDGLSPFLAAFLVVIPFFFVSLLPSITYAFYASLSIALIALFGLGAYLGTVSEGNKAIYGIKTTVAGLACMGLTLLVEVIAR